MNANHEHRRRGLGSGDHSDALLASGHRNPQTAAVLVGRPGTDARTWGYRRAEILAAAAQAAVLLAVGGFTFEFEPASHAAHEHAAHA